MNDVNQKLLAEIRGGKTAYKAPNGSILCLQTFKEIVSQLRQLAACGYIEITFEHHESQSGGRYIDLVQLRSTE